MTNSFLLLTLALGVATGALGGYIAEKKGRTQRFGFVIGFLFVVVLINLPLWQTRQNQPY